VDRLLRNLRRILFGLAAFMLASCFVDQRVELPAAAAWEPAEPPTIAVVVTLDGVRWQSLPAYAELMSGRAPSRCRNNSCRGISEPTLIDALAKTNGCLPHEAASVLA